MADYEFKYAPLTGRLTGKQMIEQTEQAINGLASLVDDAAGQVEIISTLANEANENAATALEVANEALATTGRTYITVSIPADANDYYDSELIYIEDNTSTNIPVVDTGMLEVKTNDDKTACEQCFVADSSGEAYYRHGDITAETVGDVTTYTVTWGGWSSEPASQAYVQEELANYAPLTDLANYLPLAGGTLTGIITKSGSTGVIRRDTDDSFLYIGGSTSDSNGAYLTLYGKDHSSAGRFNLTAKNGTNSSILAGYADGQLMWGGKYIPVAEKGSGYIIFRGMSSTPGSSTYSLCIQWGDYSVPNATKTQTITFTIPFYATPSIILGNDGRNDANIKVYRANASSTGFVVKATSGLSSGSAVGSWVAVYYTTV